MSSPALSVLRVSCWSVFGVGLLKGGGWDGCMEFGQHIVWLGWMGRVNIVSGTLIYDSV